MMQTGIYAIINTQTWKTYVGSAARVSGVNKRWIEHRTKLKRGCHHSKHLQSAWKKYGSKAFKFVVVEECAPEDCLRREQFWLDKMMAADPEHGYNICKTAGNKLGTPHSADAKRKVSEANKGRKLSDDHKVAIGAAQRGRLNKHAAKMCIPIKRVDVLTGEEVQYISTAAARREGFTFKSITKHLDAQTPYRGFFWSRVLTPIDNHANADYRHAN
jgi:group I intron endonuclease